MSSVHGVSVLCRLTYRILLRMDAKELVELLTRGVGVVAPWTATVESVGSPSRCSVVARGNDVVVLDDDRTDLAAAAVATLGDIFGNLKEVQLPRGSSVFC